MNAYGEQKNREETQVLTMNIINKLKTDQRAIEREIEEVRFKCAKPKSG